MKKIRRLVLAVSLLVCFAVGTLQAAEEEEIPSWVKTSSVVNEQGEVIEVLGIVYPWARGTYLSSGSAHLVLAGTGRVTLSGNTVAYQKVDSIKVALHLQRSKDGLGNWTSVQTLGPKTATNAYSVSTSQTYTVARGYYYRAYGSHLIVEGDKTESMLSYTDPLWVP